MLKLYQFPAPWDVCSASPFCAKLEAFLRWQQVPYESVIQMNLRGAPKGKVPYIVDENGKLGDSTLIMEYLIRKHKLTPDATLTVEQQVVAHAFRYVCEDGLYWAMVYFRWLDEDNWQTMRRVVFARAPFWARPFIERRIRTYVRKQLHMQGMGRHTPEEIAAFACGNLRDFADFLGGKLYLFGDTMTTADLVVFSVVSNFLTGPFKSPVHEYAATLANLVAHTNRVRERCFGVAQPAQKAA